LKAIKSESSFFRRALETDSKIPAESPKVPQWTLFVRASTNFTGTNFSNFLLDVIEILTIV